MLDWSLESPDEFWLAVASWAGLAWFDPPDSVEHSLSVSSMPGAEWFSGSTLNYTHQIALAAERPDASDRVAIIGRSQSRARDTLTWTQLIDQVARCRVGLQRLGVGRGDCVAAYLPNISETVVALLATASLGAVWSSCAPEFGARAVIDRWSQVGPKVLLAVDGYRYGDRRIDRRSHVAEIEAALPTLVSVVRLAYLDPEGPDDWSELLAEHQSLECEPVPFDHPLYVLFSSGTTGLPKPIVHGHGSMAIEHAKAWGLHYDLRADDTAMWFTTTGWMMWNFLVSALLTGSTIALFDGDPASPDLGELWRVAADEHIDVLGVSAPFLMACRKAGLRPADDVDVSGLRHLGSTGAPLPAEGFEWVAADVGGHIQVGSMSGGTDVCTAFVGTAPMLPVRAGEIGRPMLGCDVQAVRADGTRCAAGETGELVIAAPMPSMPVQLWGDEDGSRLRATYFTTFPGKWHHGDWITFFDDGACQITGRSDATLNRGGVRLGTSEFYAVVNSMPEIADSVVVHLEDTDDASGAGELILLVTCAPGVGFDDELVATIRSALRSELSPRHVPDVIDEVAGIPRTLSGKLLEVPVKKMLLGMAADEAASRDSLTNPDALDAIDTWVRAHR